MPCNIKQCLSTRGSISPMAAQRHSLMYVLYIVWMTTKCYSAHVDLLSFRINFVGFSDDDNLVVLCMPISRQNLWTIWSAFQYEIPIRNPKNCHWTKSCATLRDGLCAGWINKNQFQSETCHLQEWTSVDHFSNSCKWFGVVIHAARRNFNQLCHCWHNMVFNQAYHNASIGWREIMGFLVLVFLASNECKHCLFMFLIGKGAAVLLWGWCCCNSCFDATFLTL